MSPQYDMRYALGCGWAAAPAAGPWFQQFDQTRGAGYQISGHALRNSTTSYGAYFGPRLALKTYQAAVAS